MNDQLTVVDSAEIEPCSGDRDVLLPREEIELAQHRRSGHVHRAAEGRAIRLVRMTGEDPDNAIPVAPHDRFQGGNLTHDERRVMVRWACQATRVVEHNQMTAWSRISQLGLQPGQLHRSQRAADVPRDGRVEQDHLQSVDQLAVVVPILAVGTLLSQNNPMERRPVVVVAECKQDRRGSSAKLPEHFVDDLVAFGGAVFGEVATDDDERRRHVKLFDTCQHATQLPHRVDAGEELSGWDKMEITQVQKRDRHQSSPF
jgi:hypothetical protein